MPAAALAALCRAWQSVVEVAFSKRCVGFCASSFPSCEQVAWQPALTLLPWCSADLLPMAAVLGRRHTFGGRALTFSAFYRLPSDYRQAERLRSHTWFHGTGSACCVMYWRRPRY